MSGSPIAIGSRGSALALAQARLVAQAFERQARASEIVVLETDGDRRAPDTAWGEGAFVNAIEHALLGGRIDVAVHSAKDVPTDEDERLAISAFLPRADPRDALVVRPGAATTRLADLPPGSRVGTDSPRRTGFVLALRPDLVVHPLHGNVDTRLRRLDEGATDALVLASAGLDRLDRSDRIAERLDPDVVPPAPGQGAIAVQVRCDDERMLAIGADLDDETTRLSVETERAFLRASGGGCRAPIGALATVAGGSIELLGGYAAPDGRRTVVDRRVGPSGDAASVAEQLAASLLGALGERPMPSARRPRVLVTRAAHQADALLGDLDALGIDAVHVPTIAIDAAPGALDEALRSLGSRGSLGSFAWTVVTSANGARAALDAISRAEAADARARWAVVGRATGAVVREAGGTVGFTPARASGADLARELPVTPGDRILVVRGDRADGSLARELRARGATVVDVIAYRTQEAPESSREALRDAFAAGPIDLVVLTSGSTVRGLVALAAAASVDVLAVGAVCIGASTARAAREAGFRVLAVPETPADADIAAATARLVRPDRTTPS